MKKLFALSLLAFGANTFAIEFITEAQVGERLEAQKVIEVSKYSVQSLIEIGSDCAQDFASRSARAYIVKKDNSAALYLTSSGLNTLTVCKKL